MNAPEYAGVALSHKPVRTGGVPDIGIMERVRKSPLIATPSQTPDVPSIARKFRAKRQRIVPPVEISLPKTIA